MSDDEVAASYGPMRSLLPIFLSFLPILFPLHGFSIFLTPYIFLRIQSCSRYALHDSLFPFSIVLLSILRLAPPLIKVRPLALSSVSAHVQFLLVLFPLPPSP